MQESVMPKAPILSRLFAAEASGDSILCGDPRIDGEEKRSENVLL